MSADALKVRSLKAVRQSILLDMRRTDDPKTLSDLARDLQRVCDRQLAIERRIAMEARP